MLIQLNIFIKYVEIYYQQIKGLVDDEDNAIMNCIPYINSNHLFSMDKQFYEFTMAVETWWMNPFIDLNYKNTK